MSGEMPQKPVNVEYLRITAVASSFPLNNHLLLHFIHNDFVLSFLCYKTVLIVATTFPVQTVQLTCRRKQKAILHFLVYQSLKGLNYLLSLNCRGQRLCLFQLSLCIFPLVSKYSSTLS